MDVFRVWEGEDSLRLEAAEVELAGDGMRARGAQIGTEPLPYRLTYELDATARGFVTRSVRLDAVGEGWERRLRLERNGDGEWAAEVGGSGDAVDAPGGDTEAFAEALDCDIAFSPLTNAMPIRRHRFHEEPGTHTFLMVWISVPDLSLHASHQRYTYIERRAEGGVVRYESGSRDFVSDLELDPDGLVRNYPQLARQVG